MDSSVSTFTLIDNQISSINLSTLWVTNFSSNLLKFYIIMGVGEKEREDEKEEKEVVGG